MKSLRTIGNASTRKPYYRCPECRQRAIAKEYSIWQRKVVVSGSAAADGLRAVADISAQTEESKTAVVCRDTLTQIDDVEISNVGRRDVWSQADHVKVSHIAVQTTEEVTGTEKIDFRVGNCFEILNGVRAEAVVTSSPWGGPTYSRRFNAKDLGSREMGGMAGILKMARNIASRIVLHVPKTIDRKQCLDVSRKYNFGRVEIEDVSIDGRLNYTNLYLKLQQDNRRLGPAIQSKVDLESGV